MLYKQNTPNNRLRRKRVVFLLLRSIKYRTY